MLGIIFLLCLKFYISSAVDYPFGSHAVLVCENNTKYYGEWKKRPLGVGGRYNFLQSTARKTMTKDNLTFEDTGYYRCTYYNRGWYDGPEHLITVTGIPDVNTTPTYNKLRKSTVSLWCYPNPLTSPPPFRVRWSKKTGGSTTYSPVIIDQNKFSGGDLQTPSLTISNLEAADNGTYRCRVTNAKGTGHSDSELLIGEITEATILNEYYVTKVGEEVTLECLIKNETSNRKLYWLRGAIGVDLYLTNKYSHGTLTQPSLTITNIEISDAGNYTCKLESTFGHSEDTVVLKVLFVQVYPPLHVSPKANDSVVLPCYASGGNRVTWRRNGEKITSTDSVEYSGGTMIKPSLTISKVTRYHAGNYTCDTSYESVLATSDTQLQLSVKDIPLVQTSLSTIQASKGDVIQLECYFESYPEPSFVFWNKNGGNLTVSVSKYNGSTLEEPSLTILNTDKLDSGLYVCAVVNGIGTGYSRKIQLIIQERQKQQKYENNVSVIIGTSVSVAIFLLTLFIVIMIFIRRRKEKKSKESTYQTNEMINAETHTYGKTETYHDYCNSDIKQTTATNNDIPLLEGDCLIERYNVLELTKRLNDAETLTARIRAEFKFLESNSVKVDIPTNDYEIVLNKNQTGEPTKELKTLYIKQSAEDIFVFSSLPDDDNIEQFWSMIINYNIENIIMIVQKNEKTTSFYPTQDDVFKVAMLEIEMRSAEKTNDNIFMLRFILHDKNTRKKRHVKIFKTNWDDSDKYPSVESIYTLLEKVKIEEGRPTLMTGSKGKCFSVCGSVSLCLQSVRAIERETTFSLLEYATLLKRIEDDFIKVFDDYAFCYKVMTQYLETVHTYSFIE